MILTLFLFWEVMVTNSFETDLARSFLSFRFWASLSVLTLILHQSGYDSDLYRLCVPTVCTFPYACGFLDEYKAGYTRLALPRTTTRAYILGKFFACGISGGTLEAVAVWIFTFVDPAGKGDYPYALIFLCGFLWAVIAATLAVGSGSKYIAYGGSFVLYYFLIILNERYFPTVYCLNPHEWYAPEHIWMFGNTGIVVFLIGLSVCILLLYEIIARRRLSNV